VASGTPTALGDGGGFAGQFAAQGRRLIVGGTDGTCRIWDFSASPTTVFPSTKWLVRDLAAARVGETCLLASIQADGELRLRERGGGGASPDAWRERLATNVGGRARSLAMTGDGKLIVVGREDGHLMTYRVADGTVAQDVHPHDRTVNTARLAPDGRTLVTAGLDKTARVWSRRTDDSGWDERLALRCAGEVLGASISHDGSIIATTSRPASLRFWSTRDGRPLQHTTADKVPWKPVFGPDGKWRALGSWDLAIQFWNVAPHGSGPDIAPAARHAYSLLGHSQLITSESFDDAGKLMASVSNDGTLRIWDVSGMADNGSAAPVQDRRRCLATLDAGVGDAYAVAFLPLTPGGPCSVAVGYIDGTVRVWNLDALDDHLRGHVDHQRKLRGRDRPRAPDVVTSETHAG
jgi:WD40 repeat protein